MYTCNVLELACHEELESPTYELEVRCYYPFELMTHKTWYIIYRDLESPRKCTNLCKSSIQKDLHLPYFSTLINVA